MTCSASEMRTREDRVSFGTRSRAMRMGFKLELFVDPIDDSLKCDLCSAVYREPVITSCGHVYCVGCLRQWLGNRERCPRSCKQISLENDVTHLLPLQKLVNRLRTRCAYHQSGCEVVLTVDDMLEHMEVCDYARKESPSTALSCSDRGRPEVSAFSQVLVCKKGCGLPLLFQATSEHDCVKSLQSQVCSLQAKLTRTEHDKEKMSQRLVKREECMQERFTQLENDLKSYQEQTLNYERQSREQRSEIRYLRRQLDNRGDQAAEESDVKIVLERHDGTLGFNIRGGTEEDDSHCGIYVSKIVDNSPASKPGKLQLYDRILQIDNVDLTNASHQEVVRAFKNAGDTLDITVRRLLNPKTQDMLSSTELVSTGIQTDPELTCCRCSSNRSSQEFSSQGGINFIHQREDSGVDETGDVEIHNGCDTIDLRRSKEYTSAYSSQTVGPCDEVLNKLLLNTSLAVLDKRNSRVLNADSNQRGLYEGEDNAELRSLSNGYYSGNVSQASLENVKQGVAENGNVGHDRAHVEDERLHSNQCSVTDDMEDYSRLNETDQLFFDSELEYEYEEITIGMCGRNGMKLDGMNLGMKLDSGDGEDVNSVYVKEVDPRSVVAKDGRVIEGDQILKINDMSVTCLEDADDLLSETRNEIKLFVARSVAELQATLLGAESDHGESSPDQSSRFQLEAYPIGVIQEEDEDEAETVIGDKCEKDSGVGRTDESLKNDESSEQDVADEQHHTGTPKEQHKAQMDTLGQQIIHFTACASNAKELGLRDSPREKSSDERSQRSGEKEKRDGKSSKHSSRRSGNKTSSDENTHSSGHERKPGSKSHKSHKLSKNSESSLSVSRGKERSEGKDKDRSEHKRKKDRSKEPGDSSRLTSGSRASKDDRLTTHKQNGEQSANENGDMKIEWRVRRNKDGSRIFISKKMKPAKQKLLRERAQKLAEERRGLTTDDETQSVYLGRYWSREDRRRQLDKVREARRIKKEELDEERKSNGHNTKRNDFAIIELTHKKMASVDQTFDDFMTVDEILRQRNRLGLSNGPVFVTTV